MARDGQLTNKADMAASYITHMAFPGRDVDWRTFDFVAERDRLDPILRPDGDTVRPDLSRFRARGGRILMYFGWGDPALNPLSGIDYFEQVRQVHGPATGDLLRLFMMPGVLHCGGGPGPSTVDTITPLIQWVERGVAPDRLVASRLVDGKVVRTRPLCPHPSVAKYTGTGSVDDAANFVCSAPTGTVESRAQ
jgi:feruloyl esterase